MTGEVFILNSCELTAAVTAIANCLAENLGDDELSLVSAFFVNLGDTLALIAAHRGSCANSNSNGYAANK